MTPMRGIVPGRCASAGSGARSIAIAAMKSPLFMRLRNVSENSSLDHSIRSRQHVWWNRKADLLGGFQIDHQLELSRLFHWQVGRFRAPKDFVDEVCSSTELITKICPI